MQSRQLLAAALLFAALSMAVQLLHPSLADARAATNAGCVGVGCQTSVQDQQSSTTVTAPAKQHSASPPTNDSCPDGFHLTGAGCCKYTAAPYVGQTPLDGNPNVRPYDRECYIVKNGHFVVTQPQLMWIDPNAPPTTDVDVDALRREALSQFNFSAITPRFSPDDRALQVVNAPTWMWLEGVQQQTATASLGGVSATVTATPVSVTWRMGDGGVVNCNGVGVPYDSAKPASSQRSDCTYTYKKTSVGQPNNAFAVTATVQWHATWVVAGAAGGGDLGLVTGTSAPVAVRVGEIQAINTGPGSTQ